MYCPDLSLSNNEIAFEGDPYYYDYGQDFTFIVASCKITAKAFGNDDSNCVDEADSDVYASNLRIVYKFVTQYFDLYDYRDNSGDNSHLKFTSLAATQVDIAKNLMISHKYSVE